MNNRTEEWEESYTIWTKEQCEKCDDSECEKEGYCWSSADTYEIFEAGYKMAIQKAQKEIKELNEDIETELKMKSVYISENLKLNSHIKELTQQVDDLEKELSKEVESTIKQDEKLTIAMEALSDIQVHHMTATQSYPENLVKIAETAQERICSMGEDE